MAIYLKMLWPGDGHSIYPASQVHYGDGADLTFVAPPDDPSKHGAFYRGDFIACYVMSESGKTLDKIRGFTADEAASCPRVDDSPEADRDAAMEIAEQGIPSGGLVIPEPAATIPPEHQMPIGNTCERS